MDGEVGISDTRRRNGYWGINECRRGDLNAPVDDVIPTESSRSFTPTRVNTPLTK